MPRRRAGRRQPALRPAGAGVALALPSTLHRFSVDLSDVDRGVYEHLDFRLARHPSETVAYALVRVIAYALEYRERLEFGPGLCRGDEPALLVPGDHGSIDTWIDVGAPSADRLHKANKHADSVVVYTHRDLEFLRREWASRPIHQAEHIRVVAVPHPLLDALETTFGRGNAWTVLRSDGVLYVTVGDDTWSGEITEHTIDARP